MSFSMDELSREVSERVDAALEKSREIEHLSSKIIDGTATYADCERLASLTGTSTGKVLADALVQSAADGKVTEETARAILEKPLEDNYELVAEACRLTQEALNRKAGLGLNAVKPELPRDRINGLVTEAAGKDDVGSFAVSLIGQVENLSMSTVDDSVRENAAAHYNAGLRPRIVRIAAATCCDWCSDLEGTYEYDKVNNTGNDVFRRHTHCRCEVLYDPANGKQWQDAHSKRLLSADESAKIEARKAYGLDREIDGIPKSWKKNLEASREEVLKGTNPGYRRFLGDWATKEDEDYNKNCSNCVPAYEMRCRGYNVTAKPLSQNKGLRHNPFLAWSNPHPVLYDVHGGADISNYLLSLSENARIQIVVSRPRSAWFDEFGHTFVGERTQGGIRFVDPQSGSVVRSPERFFSRADTIEYMRIDDLELSDKGVSACSVKR